MSGQTVIIGIVSAIGLAGMAGLVRIQRRIGYTPLQRFGQSMKLVSGLLLAPYVGFYLMGLPEVGNFVLLLFAPVCLLCLALYGVLTARVQRQARLRDLQVGLPPHPKKPLGWDDVAIPGFFYSIAVALPAQLITTAITGAYRVTADVFLGISTIVVGAALVAGYALAAAQKLLRDAQHREHWMLVNGFASRERTAKEDGYQAGYRDGLAHGRDATPPPGEERG
ncbi:hypothetical protein [Clavibacter michiganensis]|uniref:hypothetical protein n=1 Tax=Clavibacter michiganensis TaxID=28447 RepID=UPI00142DB509|nr:hypothetical protein [Clavibacter michiganensis]NIY62043.1 hypothetical protein [Clavibacter michiganensis subsp. michiganensis]QIT13074.1 hypothetical protein GRD74_15920 [Clavibacter michiganensis subsp. michiganensis]